MKKRNSKVLVSGLMSACVLACMPVAGMMSASAADDIVYGDANCDNELSMADSVLIMQSLANPSGYGITGTKDEHITEKGQNNADVSNRGDGVTNKDALAIQKKLLNLISELPESFADGGAGNTTTTTTKPADTTTTVTTTTKPDKQDKEEDKIKVDIKLNGTSILSDSEYAKVEGSKVTINHSGTFNISGKLDDGQICVDIPDAEADKGTVKLVFNGASVTGKSAPAIFVNNADKTSLTVADGTENTITDGENAAAYAGDFAEKALIEAKDDFTIKGGDEGTGKLTITANFQPAISCNNDLKFTGGDVTVETIDKELKADAIKGKSSVTVKGGKLTIDSEGDGLKSSKGEVSIEDGELTIKCGKDAIQAETGLKISGGKVVACGDKGLTCPDGVEASITGGEVLVTSTDNQCAKLSAEQNTLMLDFTKEWTKNNPIAVTDQSNNPIVDINTPKKYKYAIVSSAQLADGEYKVFAGGIKMKHSAGSTFKAGKPASFTDVNNDMENEEQLYSSLFSQSAIHKIDIKMDEGTWNNLLQNASKEEWTPCDVVIDGEELKNVGIRTKGNSSLMMAQKGKYSFRLKLDKYEKDVNYHGLTELCMNNMLSDPSCLRDILCYNAMYEVDGVAPHAAHTDMYLNGNLYSFYLLAEQPGTTLAERYAVDDDSVLYKATERAGNGGGWGFGGDSYCSFTQNMTPDRFDVKFGTDDNYQHIVDIQTAINKLTSTDYKFIEDIIDVPSFLKGFAVNSIFCNYDSYNGSLAHNYYLMYSGGKAYFVGWDYNLCLGNFTGGAGSVTSDITTSLYQATIEDRPLAKLLQVPEYYDMYVDIVKDILNYYSDPEQYVAQYASSIRSHVAADPRFEFTVDDFDKNTSKSAEGLQVTDNGGGWGFGGDNGGNNGGWNFGGDQGGNNGGWNFGGDQGGNNGGWNFGGDQGGANPWGGGFQINADEPAQGGQGGWGGFGGADGGQGGWGGFGGDASKDWGNMDWGNMDWGNMDWGNMDWGNMDFGGGGGGGFGGFGGFGGGGMFGGGNTSVVDFLIKRFEVIKDALKF